MLKASVVAPHDRPQKPPSFDIPCEQGICSSTYSVNSEGKSIEMRPEHDVLISVGIQRKLPFVD